MRLWQLVEIGVGLSLVVTASTVITRPQYRANRVVLGVAVASWAVGLLGVIDGLAN